MAPTRSSTRGPMPRRRNIHCIEFLHRRPRTTASALALHSLMPFNETPKHAEKVIASPQRTTSVSDLSALVMRIWVQQQEPATALPTTVPTAIFPDQPRCRQRPTNVAVTKPESVGFLPTATSPRLMLLVRVLWVQLKTSASVFAVDNPPMISSCDGSSACAFAMLDSRCDAAILLSLCVDLHLLLHTPSHYLTAVATTRSAALPPPEAPAIFKKHWWT